eukprot:7407176-Ditylum_brightwellii.AAC.1
MMGFLKGTIQDIFQLEVDDEMQLKWFIDAAFAVHYDSNSYFCGQYEFGTGGLEGYKCDVGAQIPPQPACTNQVLAYESVRNCVAKMSLSQCTTDNTFPYVNSTMADFYRAAL